MEKVDSLFTEGIQYDVIAVQLSDNVKTGDILLDGFEEQGGGNIVYIQKVIITHICDRLELQNRESICTQRGA